MDSLQEIFNKKLKEKLGVKKNIDAVLICDAFNKSISPIFGESLKNKIKAISFRDGVLKIGVTSSVLAQEVQGHWGQLIAHESPIKKLRFEIRNNLDDL